ncbi:Oidioi.mRNA.OKI2018_I69.chr1.g884.t1.cds [Oikopleura dioica]|uniref:Oidioi.mRNA.OKI2018_I69.PAR.g12199.t1.cds n=1 Tax=Oikopleura dioica TaxID=34765 RepID=A0ABN7S2A6_OIKDI|nr:Oidioi.mRNA.OKI2018_I69.PAR.g12199.t1.cds [Oikopleura dioica]CAG5103678.1 Oidioi.mRNA.OKI2018_I69.chr1.g884.t1.cds [Oikopleura dioica]
MACDGDYESRITPCWGHPRVAEFMARSCNNLGTAKEGIQKVEGLRIRANRTTWEDAESKRHKLMPNTPFSTHLRDILLDGIRAGENLDMEGNERAGAENFFPNVWTQTQQTLEDRMARLELLKADN